MKIIWKIIAAIIIAPVILFIFHIVLLYESKWYRGQIQMHTWRSRANDFRQEYPDSIESHHLPISPALIDSTKK